MADFINTINVLGDDAVVDSIINRTITEFKDNNLTKVGDRAFHACALLTVVDMPSVTEIGPNAFTNCISLEEISFQSVKLLTGDLWVGRQFIGNSQLKRVSMPNLERIDGYEAFKGCVALKRIDFPNLTLIGRLAFASTGIIEAVFPKVTESRDGAFNYTPVTKLDFHAVTKIVAIEGILKLTQLIIRTATICTTNVSWWLTSDASPFAKGTCFIYVPRALLSDDDETKDYRRATNWSAVADKFRAIEDYSVDGTVTGELDETKI